MTWLLIGLLAWLALSLLAAVAFGKLLRWCNDEADVPADEFEAALADPTREPTTAGIIRPGLGLRSSSSISTRTFAPDAPPGYEIRPLASSAVKRGTDGGTRGGS